MKANNGSGNNLLRDNWETPQELFNELNKQYHFDLDCCANSKNSKAKYYCNNFLDNYTPKVETCWMNPPFSKATIMFEKFFNVVIHGVAIYRCDNLETKIWQKVIFPNCKWIFIPDHRVNYVGLDGIGSRFPSALIGIGVKPPENIDGICLVKYDFQHLKE